MFKGHWLAALRVNLGNGGGLGRGHSRRVRRRARRGGLAIARVESLENRALLGSLISQPAILGALVSDSYTAAAPVSLLTDLSSGTVSSGSLSGAGVPASGGRLGARSELGAGLLTPHVWDTLSPIASGSSIATSGSSASSAPESTANDRPASHLIRSDLPAGVTSNLSASVFGHPLFDAFDDFSTGSAVNVEGLARPLPRIANDESVGTGSGSGGVYSSNLSDSGIGPAATVSAGNFTVGFAPASAGFGGVAVAPRAAAAEGDPPPNQPPIVGSDGFAVANPGRVTISTASVLANATDPDGGPLTATLGTTAANGTVTTNADGSITYTPHAGFSGTDHIGYTVTDDHGLSTGGDIEVAVFLSVTDSLGGAPWAQASPDEYTFESAATMTVTTDGVLSNDEMSDGPFTATLVAGPSDGSVSLGGDGTFTYTPDAGAEFTGSDSFTYQLVDGLGFTSNAASVTINVNAAPPAATPWAVANPDVYTFEPGVNLTVASGGVLSNDATGGGSFTATLVDSPSSGAVSLNGDGTFTYTPAAGAAFTAGSDTFTYQLGDGLGTVSNVAAVTILVNAPPPPDAAWAAAASDTYSFEPAAAMSVVTDGVLSNDSSGGGQFTVTLLDAPSHGMVSLNEDGTFTYTPDLGADFTGTDTFTYQLVDGLGLSSNTATVTITVIASATSPGQSAPARAAGQNRSTAVTVLPRLAKAAPQANADPGWSPCYNYGGSASYYWVTRGGSVSGNVLSNDCDYDGPGPLRVWTYSQPDVGSLVMGTSGAFTYTPPISSVETGTSFTYQAYDGAEISSVATVSFYFRDTPNARPAFNYINNPPSVNEDSGSSQVTITGVTAVEEDQTVSFTATSSNPTVVPNPIVSGSGSTRTLTFTPAAHRFGTATITVTATDDGGTWNGGVNTFSQSFTMTVNPVNDPPSFNGIPNRNPSTTGITETVGVAGISAGPHESQTVTLSPTTDRPDLVTSLSISPLSVFTAWPNTASANLSYYIPSGASGTATITITARDDGGTANGGVDTYAGSFTVNLGHVVTIQRWPGEDNASEVGPRARSFLVDRGSEDISRTLKVLVRTLNDGGQGIAAWGPDYTGSGSTVVNNEVTIPAWTQSVALTINPIPDTLEEGTEQVVMQLAGPAPGQQPFAYSTNPATLAIEDKPYVWMSQADTEAVEGGANTGLQALQGSVRFCRSGSAGEFSQPLTVNFTTVNPPPTSRATYGGAWVSDYGFTNPVTGTSFSIGVGKKCDDLVVAPYWDGLVEGPEEAKLLLDDSSGSTYLVDRYNWPWTGRPIAATVNIEDTDPPKVWMSQADSDATEGAANTGSVSLMGSVRFHRHGNPSQPLTVNFMPSGSATYGMGDGQDYGFTNPVGVTNTSFTIPAGKSWDDLVIAPRYDNLFESTETAYINLMGGTDYRVDWTKPAETSASVSITDVDPFPSITSLSVSPAQPGIAEDGGTATISATLSNASAYPVTIPLTFLTGTGLATPNVDYTTSASSIPISAGSTTGRVTLTAQPDTLDEPNELVRIQIASTTTVTNATVPTTLEAGTTILDDDLPTVTIVAVDPDASETSNSGKPDPGEFRITRSSGDLSQSLTISLQVTGAATPSQDYNSLPTAVTIPANETSTTVAVMPRPDTAIEQPETVNVQFVANTGQFQIEPSHATATVTITDTKFALAVFVQYLMPDAYLAPAPEDSNPPPPDPANPFGLTPEDRKAFQQARDTWKQRIGMPSVSPNEKAYSDLFFRVSAAEEQLRIARQEVSRLTAMASDPNTTKAMYITQLERATYAYDRYLFEYQRVQRVMAQFLEDQWFLSSADEALLAQAQALQIHVDGLETRLTSDHWNTIRRENREITEALDKVEATAAFTEGALKSTAVGVAVGVGVGAGVVVAVAFLPVTVVVAGGAIALGGGIGYAAGTRLADGQDAVEVVGGSVMDVTGFSAIYASVYDEDIATGQPRNLTPQQRGELFGTGTVQLVLTTTGIAASGQGQVTSNIRLPKLQFTRGGVMTTPEGFGFVQLPAVNIAGTTVVPVSVSVPTVTASGALGTLDIIVYATATSTPTGSGTNLSTIPNPRAAEDAGVQLGREHVKQKYGLKDTDFVNPKGGRGTTGDRSQGLDDVLEDAQGNYWIGEYKGGTGALDGDQMQRTWIEAKIAELKALSEPYKTWGEKLDAQLQAGRLHGVATSTPFSNGIAGETAEILGPVVY